MLYCLEEASGQLLWQLVVPKRHEDPYFDWPQCGIASTATVESNRVYVVSNRGEVLCLDTMGMSNGNQGPYLEEGARMTPYPDGNKPRSPKAGESIEPILAYSQAEAMDPGLLDADIIWIYDMVKEAGIWPHDGAHSSILIRGQHLYLNTGTGVDNTHKRIRKPDAPSLIVLDKITGKLIARDNEGIGPNIFHSTWAGPSMASPEGQDRIFFNAGNGFVYAFKPIPISSIKAPPYPLQKVWAFDFDPDAPKTEVHRFHNNRQEGPSNFYAMPVYSQGNLYVAGGGDLWWGKNAAWLKCLEARSGRLVWSQDLGRHVFSSPAVADGLVFQADNSRFLYCFDERTGERYWRHEAKGEFWASPLVADSKVYIGSRKGDFWILSADRHLEVLYQANLGAPISSTAVAANQTLYLTTMFELLALSVDASN